MKQMKKIADAESTATATTHDEERTQKRNKLDGTNTKIQKNNRGPRDEVPGSIHQHISLVAQYIYI
jgi:hypothetical protein